MQRMEKKVRKIEADEEGEKTLINQGKQRFLDWKRMGFLGGFQKKRKKFQKSVDIFSETSIINNCHCGTAMTATSKKQKKVRKT